MSDHFSLRDLWDANFKRFEDKIDAVAADVSELKSLANRVNELEFTVRVLKWIGGVITTMVLALAVSAIRGWLGI